MDRGGEVRVGRGGREGQRRERWTVVGGRGERDGWKEVRRGRERVLLRYNLLIVCTHN